MVYYCHHVQEAYVMHSDQENSRPAIKPIKQYALCLTAAYAIYITFICLNNVFASNVVFQGTMLYEITEWIYLAVELAAFFLVYAVSIYAVFQRGYKAALTRGYVYCAITFSRHLILFILNWAFFGLRTRDVPFQLLMTLINLVLELLQYAIIFAVAMLLTHRFDRYVDVMKSGAARLKGVVVDRRKLVFPFKKIPLKNDPLRASSLLGAIIISAVRVASRISFDISYGAPANTADLLWMIAYYTLDVLIGVVAYFVMLYVIIKMTANESDVG